MNRCDRIFFMLMILISTVLIEVNSVMACEICTIPRLGRQERMVLSEDAKHQWYFEFLFEEQNWDAMDATAAHLLHEDGHDVHNKKYEHFYHFTFGRAITDDLTISLDLPYVIKKSLGVEDGKVGNKDTSEGLGDLLVLATYRIFGNDQTAVSAVGGVKFPTGVTDDRDSTGDLFEPELQPGSGSHDFLLGGVFEHHIERFIVKGNATYSFKNKGEQNFKHGNLLSTSLFVDVVLNPDSEYLKTKAGVDLNYQYAQKDETDRVKDPDSGGHTLLAGPTLTIESSKDVSFFGNILFPVVQDLNGVHQELDYVWTLGGKVGF